MAKGTLSKRLRYALEHAEHLNKGISLHDYELPAVVSGGKLETYICNSTEGVKVVVRCEGCMPGKQHYRKSTPKALCKRGALQCRFCTVCAAVPAVCNVVMPHAAEQLFMRVLWGFGWDEKFCFQVVPPFWHRCVDFLTTSRGTMFRLMGHAIGQTCTNTRVRRCWVLTLSKHNKLWPTVQLWSGCMRQI